MRFILITLTIILGSKTFATECAKEPSYCSPKELCKIATENVGDKVVWSSDNESVRHIQLVKQLGMSCGNVMDVCDIRPSECTVKQLCKKATISQNNKFNWNFDALEHVALAKDYGLGCNVGDSSKKDTTAQGSTNLKFSKQDFGRLNTTKRKQMQFALKQLGYYKSNIDGLWGRGTSSAVNSYAADLNIYSGFPNSVFQSLSSKVNMQDFSETVASKPNPSSSTRKQKLCKISGLDPFDRMEKRLDWEVRTKRQFEQMRQLTLAGQVLSHGENQIRFSEEGDWKWVFPLWCRKNDNNWRPCGSPSARIQLKRTSSGLKGQINVPWEWPHGLPATASLDYICK